MEKYIKAEVDFLRQLGSRTTGSNSQNKLIKRVADQLKKLGYVIYKDNHKFRSWRINDKHDVTLHIDGQKVDVAAAYPYSGTTGEQFIEGKVCFLKSKDKQEIRKVFDENSKKLVTDQLIGVYKVPNIKVPTRLALRYLENYKVELPSKLGGPLITASLAGCAKVLKNAKEAGFKALIFVWYDELAPEEAENQYIPFIENYHNLPAIWLSAEQGTYLANAVKKEQAVKFMLNACIEEDVNSQTIWAVSEADKNSAYQNESIIIATHSDGVNSIEENGHIGLVQLARWAKNNDHKRNLIFIFATGHLRLPMVTTGHDQALSAWLLNHQSEWNGEGDNSKKAVAGLVIEHLGALQKPVFNTARKEFQQEIIHDELVYVTTDELYKNIFKPNWHNLDEVFTVAVKPLRFSFLPGFLRRKIPTVHFGEGQPLFKYKIPTIALVTGPSYLMTEFYEEQPILEDLTVIQEQIESFREILLKVDSSSVKQIGKLN